jgi:DNA-binding Lrp family transcriptional regulator
VEFAPLRPVPLIPAGPVDPDRAVAHVTALLPDLEHGHARALAMVVLVGHDRAAASAELELPEPELARALALARTALRRSVRPLEGSGWCRRAEALVSDRLDGALDEAGAARLDVHLRNCPRCVEHERRLIQGQNGLVGAFGRAPADADPAELTLVQPAEEAEPVNAESLASIVAVSAGALIVLAALLVIAAIVFALVALLGL